MTPRGLSYVHLGDDERRPRVGCEHDIAVVRRLTNVAVTNAAFSNRQACSRWGDRAEIDYV